MTEMTETAPETPTAAPAAAESAPAAPQSTQDIARSTIAGLESADSQATEESEAAVTAEPTAPAVVEPPRPAKELTVEEQLLAEFGFKEARRADGREHYISRSKVLQMIGSGLKRGQARWDGERTSLERERDTLKAEMDALASEARGPDTKAFLQRLASIDPRYAEYLKPPTADPAPAAVPVGEMPPPDVRLADGSATYSLDGLKKLLEWNTAAVEARLLPKLDERLKPITEREQQAKEREQAEEATRAIHDRVRQQLETAKTWERWEEFQPEVERLLKEDSQKAQAEHRRPTMTLREAYLEAKASTLATEHNTVREGVLKELQAAPRSTSVTASGVEHSRAAAVRSTADIARAIVAQSGG